MNDHHTAAMQAAADAAAAPFLKQANEAKRQALIDYAEANGLPVIAATEAEHDAMVAAGTDDPNAVYIWPPIQ